jgi:hypothetical protein
MGSSRMLEEIAKAAANLWHDSALATAPRLPAIALLAATGKKRQKPDKPGQRARLSMRR